MVKEFQVGSAKVTVKYEEEVVKNLLVTIVKNNSKPLFGLDWLDHINLNWEKLFPGGFEPV